MTAPDEAPQAARSVNLGLRLRIARKDAGYTLRELARRLGVSPSFLSQIENGKAQPSVATLYSMAQMLEVSIDHLFDPAEPAVGAVTAMAVDTEGGAPVPAPVDADLDIPTVLQQAAALRQEHTHGFDPDVRRTDLGGLDQVWEHSGNTARLSVTAPGNRTRLVMDSGVVWEQLATNTAHQIDFMEITYPPGSSSTSDERMLRHEGFEYGYLLTGRLEVTLGFDVFTLRAGDAMGLKSDIPHLFRNRGIEPAKGIWFVHHRHD